MIMNIERSLHLSTKQATQSENNIQNINVREYRRGNQKDNPEKPATQGTQDEEKQSKNTTHVLSCLPVVGGSLWVLRLLPPLKLVAMI
jgi:pyruvate/2-oxoacid:ferredoxin oxidoreductase alpha subunit